MFEKKKPQPKPGKKSKVTTQKYPFYPKPDRKKWENEATTKKERQEIRDYYGNNPS